MEEEITQLRDLVAQLRAENLQMRQEREANQPGPSAASTSLLAPGAFSAPAPLTETDLSS